MLSSRADTGGCASFRAYPGTDQRPLCPSSQNLAFHRAVRLEKLDILALLRTQDAARSAILAGTVQNTLTCLPLLRRESIRIRVLPEFFRAHSTLAVRCIIRLRVGTIILTAMMLLIAYFREQRLTESEAV